MVGVGDVLGRPLPLTFGSRAWSDMILKDETAVLFLFCELVVTAVATSLPVMRYLAKQPFSVLAPRNDRQILVQGHLVRAIMLGVMLCQCISWLRGGNALTAPANASIILGSLLLGAATLPFLLRAAERLGVLARQDDQRRTTRKQ